MIVALLIKPALVLGAAAVITLALRRRSAAARHAVWAGAIVATLALPILSVAVPRVSVPAPRIVTPTISLPVTRPSAAARSTVREQAPLDTRAPILPLPDALLGFWIAGALLLGARRVIAELRLKQIVRRSRPFKNESLGTIRLSDEVSSPAVAGVIRPVILLPSAAAAWADADLRAVLVHEMGHIARGDCLFNLAGDLVRIAYWCNPLAHFAVRRMRVESERACDDRVVLSGAEPVGYAHLLLAMARNGRVPGAATAMARPRELESRLLAVLDAQLPRRPLRRGVQALVVGLGILFTLPAAALTLRAAPLAAEPDQRGDSLASPLSERLPLAPDAYRVSPAAREALAGPDSMLVHALVLALDHRPEHVGDLVRDRAAWALSQARAGRLVEPLLDALNATDWRIQSYAAWTLAIARDPRSTPALIPLLGHPVWRLRAMAAHALSESRDPRAQAAMNTALGDVAWQVRLEAVEYFAEIDKDRLRPLLNDRHVAVRLAAARALDAH